MLGKGDHGTMIEERDRELDRARTETASAAKALERARADLDAARDSAASAREALTGSATTLAAISGALDVAAVEGSKPDSLEAAYANIGAVLEQRHEATALELERTSEAITAERTKLDGALSSLGLDDVDAFTAALGDAAIAKGAADAEVAALKERITSEKELKGTIETTVARRDRLERLAKDLTPANFLRFLLEEDRATLAELGSEHCETLTNGRYRFSDDGEFRVVDLNAAEQTRKADSLSGGETFLASLALALALAEMVSRGGGRLDAFFLDEGFGSLDAEHMDLAMDGIDRLVDGSETRLVVLVSHVAEMRERLEDLIMLDKDPVTGDTLVKSGAGTKT
jgi:exonuclease SbcC